MIKKKNKGFSLIELIIVIAIMGILVGVVAPQLMKYMRKSKVAADRDTLSGIFATTVYAMCDPEVSQDEASAELLRKMVTTAIKLDDIPADSKLGQEILDTLKWPDLTRATYSQYFRLMQPDSYIYVQNYGSLDKPITMWITYTDESGGNDTSDGATDWTKIRCCISIRQENVH
jgi:prepilin-type N-terminal cleavage/methylation domain-containing protein